MSHEEILVGLGGGNAGERALHWAGQEASARGARLHLMRSYCLVNGSLPGEAASDRIIRADLHRTALRRLHVAEARLRQQWPDLDIVCSAVDGAAASSLVAASAQAELTVVGSRSFGAFGAFLRDSVSSLVAARAHGPVVVVDGIAGDPAERPPVVVGVDASHAMDDVLAFAFDYADRHGRVMHAMLCERPELLVPGRGPHSSHEEGDRFLAEALAGWQEKFPGVEVQRGVAVDTPARGLVAAGAAAELIVVGDRSRHPRLAAMLGSVTQGVLHHATCPVAVVPSRTDPS